MTPEIVKGIVKISASTAVKAIKIILPILITIPKTGPRNIIMAVATVFNKP